MSRALTFVRASALTWYTDCNRRAMTRLLRREINAAGYQLRSTPRGIAAAIGTAVHRGAEIALKEKAASGALPPSTVATDCAAETYGEQLREGVVFDQTTTNRTEGEVQTVGMIRAYHRVIAPTIEPLAVEERLEAEIEPGLVLSGRADVVAREPRRLRDLKTTVRLGGSHAAQIGAYSLLNRSHGLDLEDAAVDQVQRVRVGKPQPDPVSKPVPLAAAETAASNIIRMIARDLDVFRNGDPERRIAPGDPWAFAANPNSMLCSDKYCPAWGGKGAHAFCSEWREGTAK